jgi:hypothetical protein
MYEQDGIPWLIAALPQFAHDANPVIPCGLLVWQMHAIGIVVCMVGFANDEVITRHVISSAFGSVLFIVLLSPLATATYRNLTF